MPTNEQQNQPLESEEILMEEIEETEITVPVSASEAGDSEESPAPFGGMSDPGIEGKANFSTDSLESIEGSAPFEGMQDPGLDPTLEAGEEGEEADAPEPIVYRELDATQLQASVEATLFMHHKPISLNRLRELINPEIPEDEYRTAISNIMASHFEDSRGLELVEVAGGYQMRTKGEHKDIMRRIYQIAPMKLTNAMLEVLAIVAYNQPSTREDVDKIRGVDSSHLLRVLLDKKMLRIVGKSDDIGRPMIYGTTKEFLELFGLRDLGALPTLRDIEEMLPQNEVGAEISEEEALAKEMEGIVDASSPLEFNDLELEDIDGHEIQKAETKESSLQQEAHSHSGKEEHSTQASGTETGGEDLSFETEASRRLPLGPEGNA